MENNDPSMNKDGIYLINSEPSIHLSSFVCLVLQRVLQHHDMW